MNETEATKKCKFCQSEIPKKAKICPHCRKKQKKGFLKWLIIAVVAIIVLSSSTENSTDPEQPVKAGNVENTPTPTSTTAPVQTEYYVGDILLDGDMKIVYMSSGDYAEDNAFSAPKEGNKYIFLQFAFENTSDKYDDSISIYSFECYADGYAAEMYYGGEEDLSASLSAGRITTGYVYFEVPSDATDIEIEYTPNAFINEKITFIYEGNKTSGYTPTLNTTATPGAHQVGDSFTVDELNITYLSCEEYTSYSYLVAPRSGYRYISCEFEFENTGKNDVLVSCYDFYCYADGISCDAHYSRDDTLSATLSSGRKAKGTVTFEVPIDATIVEVEFLENLWTSERIVFSVQ